MSMTIEVKKDKSGPLIYLNKIPAFIVLPNGQKEAVTPSGWQLYRGNEVQINEWLESMGRTKNSPSGQLP